MSTQKINVNHPVPSLSLRGSLVHVALVQAVHATTRLQLHRDVLHLVEPEEPRDVTRVVDGEFKDVGTRVVCAKHGGLFAALHGRARELFAQYVDEHAVDHDAHGAVFGRRGFRELPQPLHHTADPCLRL